MYHKGLLIYALNSQNDFVHIDDVAKGLACNCYCPSCKERLVAKNGGKKRIHHFSHASGVDCEGAYESMLHQLAKIRVQEAFLNKSEFYIQFNNKSYCSKFETCKFVRGDNCHTISRSSFNLKDYYDSCEQEVKYDSINRRSDLKIYSSKYHQRQPIYIEFYVTHACDEFKLHNGGKVIEVKIKSEKDIDKIIEQGLTESTKCNHKNSYFDDIFETNYITFWNFKAEDFNNSQICHEIKFLRYILYPSGKSQCYQDVSSCRNLVKSQKQSLLEICFFNRNSEWAHKAVMYYLYEIFGMKNCPICKYYAKDLYYNKMICWFKDNNLGINIKRPPFEPAEECPDFSLNIHTVYRYSHLNEVVFFTEAGCFTEAEFLGKSFAEVFAMF